jgi:uncharacterized UBP type Zn finger protein
VADILRSEGLPNIGNTCFLNSVLQQLYRIDPLKEFITQSKDESGLIKILKEIFDLMPIKDSKSLKKHALKRLVLCLKEIKPSY